MLTWRSMAARSGYSDRGTMIRSPTAAVCVPSGTVRKRRGWARRPSRTRSRSPVPWLTSRRTSHPSTSACHVSGESQIMLRPSIESTLTITASAGAARSRLADHWSSSRVSVAYICSVGYGTQHEIVRRAQRQLPRQHHDRAPADRALPFGRQQIPKSQIRARCLAQVARVLEVDDALDAVGGEAAADDVLESPGVRPRER